MGKIACCRGSDSFGAHRVSGFVACSVYIVLLPDSRVGNVCGNKVANARVVCLRVADVAFFRGDSQQTEALWSIADRVEIRFRGSNGDQMRKGAVLTRVRKGPSRPVGARGGAVDLMIELTPSFVFLPSPAPRVTFGTGNGRRSMRTQQQATASLRAVVALLAGVRAENYALHFLRIGGSTHLSADGASPEVLLRVRVGGRPTRTRFTYVVMGRTPIGCPA